MVLYDNPASSNALKVRFALRLLDLPFETRRVEFTQPRVDWYLAVNPVGGIPTLDDDGFVLAESNTILRYLATREGRDDLYPADGRERARVDEFLDRFSLTFRPALFRIERYALGFKEGHGFDGVPRDPDAAREAAGKMADTLRIFDGVLAANGTVLGTLTIADLAAAPVVYRTIHTGLDLGPYPRIAAFRETVTAHPAFQGAGPVV
jgi:glutathione S-transferase